MISIASVLDFGADITGQSDSAAAFNAALASTYVAGGAVIDVPPGRFLIGSAIVMPTGASKNVHLRGGGHWATTLVRKPSFTYGNLIAIDEANGGGATAMVSGMRIENGNGFAVTGGAAIYCRLGLGIILRDIEIWDGFGGINVSSSSNMTIDNVRYLQTAGYANIAASAYGLKIAGRISGMKLSNSSFCGQNKDSPNNLAVGIDIYGADGIQAVNVDANGKTSVRMVAGYESIDDVYFSNCIFDNPSTSCLVLAGQCPTGKVFTNIRFDACHFNGGAQDAIQIGGDCDEVAIHASNINLAGGAGIVVGAGNNYQGVPKRSIQIHNNDISENNLSNTPNTHGVAVNAGASGLSLIGNNIRNRTAVGHQKYGIALGDGLSDCMIALNKVSGNELGGIYPGTGHTNHLCAMNQ